MRILILVIAGGAALLAAMLVRNMSSQPAAPVVQLVEEGPEEPAIPLSQVLVANIDMQVGHRIAPDDLEWQSWPEERLSDAYFTEASNPDAMTELAGAIVRIPVFSGEPVLAQKVVQVGDKSMLTAVLSEGMRAVAVEISVETAAGGFILPGDRVDVILSYDREVAENDMIVERPATRTVLQNVRVLAIDQSFQKIEDEDVVVGTTATLELKPAHAETLMLATRMGEISLSLRGLSDSREDAPDVIAAGSLEAARDNGGTVRIYRSGSVEQTSIGGNQ
ncbi:Flp pilus assembly protein CpaB [Ponticaulis profundi]|uniref:Flp pilus assembly protein CpaB n=1 Tax=Ponticaulis profundi TaxID=2665222 RepID=A0ABW1S9R6_9PROT